MFNLEGCQFYCSYALNVLKYPFTFTYIPCVWSCGRSPSSTHHFAFIPHFLCSQVVCYTDLLRGMRPGIWRVSASLEVKCIAGSRDSGSRDRSSIPVFRDPVGVVYAMHLGEWELRKS